MIAIVHYGLGNVQAFDNIFRRLNIAATLATKSEHLDEADRIILPGVGAFDWAMERLNSSGLRDALERAVVTLQKPILGVCVGMQIMAQRSEEGDAEGLGWIDGEVKRFTVSSGNDATRLPHMGWNDIRVKDGVRLFSGLESNSRFYFLHSYYFQPKRERDVLADTHYSVRFASSVGSGTIYGVQFHPEKSHQWGIKLLKNFAEL